MMGLWFPACGEDAAPGSGSKGEVSYSEGEGEGDQPGGEGEGEGEDARPPGADGGQCGGPSGNACQDGLECGAEAEEPDICTCPQWMEGTWWAEFPEVRRTDGQEYDFMASRTDRQFWQEQEVTFEQDGCAVRGPDRQFLWSGGVGQVKQSPAGFSYERMWEDLEGNRNHPLRSSGNISEDQQSVRGTCEGEYRNFQGDWSLFPISCTFTLTRRE